ncbi:MAG TPA: hypothetical protein VNO20_08615 [Solirubrobacterales bacterium]|nr:hypothetical protein [Solirubrobacterales bacterium]
MAADPHTHSAGRALAAMAIFVVMLFAALALWTAIPLSWIWIGSKVAETQFPATGPYMVVAVGIILSILLTSWLLTRLNQLYVRVTGTNRLAPMRPAWMKSMRDTSAPVSSTTVVEAVLMGSVLLAAVALTFWFFFLAGSPLPSQ